jgi:hypothetical protein
MCDVPGKNKKEMIPAYRAKLAYREENVMAAINVVAPP